MLLCACVFVSVSDNGRNRQRERGRDGEKERSRGKLQQIRNSTKDKGEKLSKRKCGGFAGK